MLFCCALAINKVYTVVTRIHPMLVDVVRLPWSSTLVPRVFYWCVPLHKFQYYIAFLQIMSINSGRKVLLMSVGWVALNKFNVGFLQTVIISDSVAGGGSPRSLIKAIPVIIHVRTKTPKADGKIYENPSQSHANNYS